MPKPRRKGAGRKPKGERAGVPHTARPELSSKHPVQVTMKVRPDVGFLRKPKLLRALQRAADCSAAWSRAARIFRICHVSMQGDHVHMLVEAENKKALSRGMQGFTISAAKRINKALGRTGNVFADRYHARILTSPLEVRRALAYTLNNWRHHGFDRHSDLRFDPYATGYALNGWSDSCHVRYGDRRFFLLWHPKTWLLSTGWKRHGLLSTQEVPGARTAH